MKTLRASTSLAAAMRIAIAITCLTACSGGFGRCSNSKGCGGCRRERDDRRDNKDNAAESQLANHASSTSYNLYPADPAVDTAPLPRPASGVALDLYPPPPIGQPSRAFGVRIGGKPAYVERYRDVSYVRFAFKGSVDLDIDVDAPITTHRVLPADAIRASRQSGKTLRLSLPEPSSVVVWIDGLEKLFVLADPIESAPTAGTDGVASVADFGAAANAPGVATVAIQSAIDAASTRSGGGTVLFPPGRYVSGTLRVKSNVTLYFAAGALLEGSPDPGDYPIDAGRGLLLVDEASSVRIRGRGTIDGQGSFLRQRHDAVPNLIRVRQSENVTIEDMMFRDSAAWAVRLLASRGALLRNVKVLNDRTNLDADGIDRDMSTDATIDRTFIYTKDNAVFGPFVDGVVFE